MLHIAITLTLSVTFQEINWSSEKCNMDKSLIQTAYNDNQCCDDGDACASSFWVDPQITRTTPEGIYQCMPKSAFFIGNSYTYWDNILYPKLLENVIDTYYKNFTLSGAYSDEDFRIMVETIPGHYLFFNPALPFLDTMYHNYYDRTSQDHRRASYVFLQDSSYASRPGSYNGASRPEFSTKAITMIAKGVHNRGMKTIIEMTPDQHPEHKNAARVTIDTLKDHYIPLAYSTSSYILPSALAFENMYNQYPEVLLHDYDGSHHSPYGSMLKALTAAYSFTCEVVADSADVLAIMSNINYARLCVPSAFGTVEPCLKPDNATVLENLRSVAKSTVQSFRKEHPTLLPELDSCCVSWHSTIVTESGRRLETRDDATFEDEDDEM